MSKKLVFLHTVASLIEPFNELSAELLPTDVKVVHVADGILLTMVLEEGELSPFVYRRVCDHVVAAEQAGADVVLLTCSSISPCADPARLMARIPVLKVDEPLADKAISLGARIGVAATARTTLGPTKELIYTRADATGKQVVVDPVLCEEAYDALSAGDVNTHDQIVRHTLRDLMARNDVVVLAQASMARVADTIPAEERAVPILSSPRLAIEYTRDILRQMVK